MPSIINKIYQNLVIRYPIGIIIFLVFILGFFSMHVKNFENLDINHLTISKNIYTPGKSLNMGIERCDNEVTLVISAHCEIVSWTNWIPKTIKSLGAIWGKQIPIWDGKRVTPRYLWSNFFPFYSNCSC